MLHNVATMALAPGVPAPVAYVLENEDGINASLGHRRPMQPSPSRAAPCCD
jgi:hypothetical protein